jgi:phosphoribosyl-AMP cyclohydrolase
MPSNDTQWNMDMLSWDGQGLIPAIVQDATTKQVLTLAYMNAESLRRTLEVGETVFWSRSRGQLWHKGETSGNVQKVRRITVDCDADALLILVDPAGPACHTGNITCFYRVLTDLTE